MIKVILKVEHYEGKGEVPVIFLPEDSVSKPGFICYCSPEDGHGEASLNYFHECKPFKGDAEKLLEWYSNYGGEPVELKRVYRQSQKMREQSEKAYWVADKVDNFLEGIL